MRTGESEMFAKIAVAVTVAAFLVGTPNLGYAQAGGGAIGGRATSASPDKGGPADGSGVVLPGTGSSTIGTGSSTNGASSGTSGPTMPATGGTTRAAGSAGSLPGVTGTGSMPGQTTTK